MSTETPQPSSPDDLSNEVAGELDRAEVADDEARLSALEAVHARLENELEGDVDQAGPSRH